MLYIACDNTIILLENKNTSKNILMKNKKKSKKLLSNIY